MHIHDFNQRLTDLGAKPMHIGRITRAWLRGMPLDTGTRNQKTENFLPLAVRNALPEISSELDGLARLSSEHPATDGSARLLVELADKQMVESVLLPRDGLCVSSQVGCAVGCVFCMTGKSGLLRQLSTAEIVAQVALARRFRAVKKVVFMGMGEPAHNLDNVLDAIELLVDGKLYGGWLSASVNRAMNAAAGAFTLAVTDRWTPSAEVWAIEPGDLCDLRVDGEVVITGFVDMVKPQFTKDGRSINVQGRDRSGDMVDCSAVHTPDQWKNIGLLKLAEILAKPFGIAVKADADLGGAFPLVKLQQGETALEAINRLTHGNTANFELLSQGRLGLTIFARQIDQYPPSGSGQSSTAHSLIKGQTQQPRNLGQDKAGV